MSQDVPTTYSDPVRIAVIGGTGLQALPNLTHAATLTPETPWGSPSSPIHILHHTSTTSSSPTPKNPTPVAFLARHGPHHALAPHEVPNRANIAALRSIGVRVVVAFSAVGSLREEIRPRDFVVPGQVIDRTKGVRPWTFFEEGVVAHVSFADPFDETLRAVINDVASKHGVGEGSQLHKDGTLICMEGPQFSTRAESHLYRSWGGSVINMSALPEAKLAREAELSYAMVCMATDYDCWRSGSSSFPVGSRSLLVGGRGGGAEGKAEDERRIEKEEEGGSDGVKEKEKENERGGDVSVEMVMAAMAANAENARALVGRVLDELTDEVRGHSGLVEGRVAEGGTTGFAAGVTAMEGRGKETVEKLRWLFPGKF